MDTAELTMKTIKIMECHKAPMTVSDVLAHLNDEYLTNQKVSNIIRRLFKGGVVEKILVTKATHYHHENSYSITNRTFFQKS